MTKVKSNPILLLSPLDPTCQSGLVNDAIILNRLGKSTLTICTCIASQNDIEIDDLNTLSFEEIKRQLAAIGRRYWIDWAVLSGVYDLNLASAIISYLIQTRPGIKILWQPVLQHTDKAYHEKMHKQELELFENLCKKVHTVFIDHRDQQVFPVDSFENFIQQLSRQTTVYLAWHETQEDKLYSNGQVKPLEKVLPLNKYEEFLSALSSFLYDGHSIEEACYQTTLFLAPRSIN